MDDLTAPSLWSAHPTAPDSPTPPGVTYRFIVRVTVPGKAVRLRFSNPRESPLAARAGTQPVTFGRVRVGVRAGRSGAGLLPGTDKSVTFHGNRAVTIAPDGSILSDRVDLAVRRLQDLAVSVYVAKAVAPPLHPQTYVTQYLTRPGAGDRTGESSGLTFVAVQEPIYWLDAAEVLTPAPRAMVAIGDSITDGEDCQPKRSGGACTYTDDFAMNKYPTYPEFLARRIAASKRLAQTAVVNEGVNADSLNGFAGRTVGLDGRLQHDLLQLPGVTDVVLEFGTNDVTLGMSATQVIQGLERVVAMLHERGIRVIGATLVPREGYAFDSRSMDAARARVNGFIRMSPIFAGVLDIAKALGRHGNDNRYQPRYDSGDHLHPNTAGRRAIADSLKLSFLR